MNQRSGSSPDPELVREQIRTMERQLLTLRRQLAFDAEPLPDRPFAALEVRVGSSWYALPLERIVEVLAMVWPHPLPEAPPWVMGCVDIGGEIVPLIDLQRRLEGKAIELRPEHAMVLVRTRAKCAMAISEPGDVITISPEEVAPPPAGIPQAPFLVGALSRSESPARFLLSDRRLSQDFVLDDDVELPGEAP